MKSKRIHRGSVLGAVWLCLLFALVFAEQGYANKVPLSEKVQQQQRTVTGKVMDLKGVPLPGVSVVIKGKQGKGVATDFDGNYSIEVGSDDVLVFSYIGFVTQEINVKGKTKVNVILKDDVEDLEEVVVVGYGTMRKKDLTGAITSIKPEESLAATSNSVENLLQGQVAGINVSTGGSTPGAAASIVIRGANSLKGDSQPLYVIDNVPQSSTGQTMASTANDFQMAQDPLAGINPNDIESIEVLKDASATAIYGSRGANGVIIITTKRGKEGKAKITVSANTSFSSAVNLMPLMNLREYAEFYNKYAPNGDPKKIGFRFEGDQIIYKYNEREAVVHYTDWMNEALRTANSNTYSINANGGSRSVKYNVSLGYKDVEGIVQKTGFEHGDFRLNLNTELTDKIKVNFIATGFIRKNNMMPGGNPYGAASGSIINAALDYRPYEIPRNDPQFGEEVNMTTVFSWIDDYQDITKEYRYTLSGDLNYKVTPHLTYTFRAGGNMNNIERKSWYGLQLSLGRNNNGYLGASVLDRNNYNIENLLNYNKSFGGVNVALTAGVTYDAYTWLNTREQGTDFPYTILGVNGMHIANTIKRPNPAQRDYQLLSYLGRANVALARGRYILTATFRADGTSKFQKDHRWGYFPSFSIAWNVKEENFMKSFKTLNQLKLRAGYGETGSQGINPYQTLYIYANGTGYADEERNQLRGLGVAGLNNTELLWESTSSFNAGIDFGILKNRISGTVDVYTKRTDNLLMDIALPASTSFRSYSTNRGSVYNKGIEGSLDIDVVKAKGFTWNIGGNIAVNRSKFEGAKSFFGNKVRYFGAPNIFIDGETPGLFYGFKTDGIVQEADEAAYKKAFKLGGEARLSNAGAIKIADTNGDGIINRADQVVLGDPNPDFTYGLKTSLSYKRAKLSASFTGVKGGLILNTYSRFQNIASYNAGVRNMSPAATANAWTPENPGNFYPAIRAQLLDEVVLDRYLESGTYFRCTDITLDYDLPRGILDKIKMNRIRFYLSVKNAFTVTNYSGFDVTSRSYYSDPTIRGVDRYSFPDQRTFILGGSFTF